MDQPDVPSLDVVPVDVGRGYRLITFETIGSTNTEAMQRLRAGDPGQLWVFSPEQTAGRGRRGRAWATNPGNLAVSLGLILDVAPARAATLGFVAGLALGTALHYVLPQGQFRMALDGADLVDPQARRVGRLALKWPNDVTLDGAKLSGILLEAERLGDGRFGVVIGMGVNVISAPEGLPYPATSLKALGLDIAAETLLKTLMEVWPDLYAIWREPDGFSRIRDGWLALAQGLGERVAVSLGARQVSGTFETIDADGRLIVMDEDGVRHAIAAGDVHFGVAASARPED
jgi:BirA family biotin operon repressor/biotin-[acetyl-CoA-carboxylase] ligase